MSLKNWDIFCRVLDNYGDIGVCWRLARQLASEYGATVRLWVDDLPSCRMLVPEASAGLDCQHLHGVELRAWPDAWRPVEPGDVVVESFACELPAPFVAAMATRSRPPAWINLEYLSAEAWIEGTHGLPSPHPTLPLRKHFFFPGFTRATGGLPRERGLLDTRRQSDAARVGGAALTVFLFGYGHPAMPVLLDAWAGGSLPLRLRLPPGKAREQVAEWLGGSLPDGANVTLGALRVEALPFVAQEDFDALLWDADLLFVRGEDSAVRAMWAGRPFVWQFYPQADDARRAKMEAFLERHGQDLSPAARKAEAEMFRAWNLSGNPAAAWPAWLASRAELMDHAERWCARLENLGDLAENLVKFCAERVK